MNGTEAIENREVDVDHRSENDIRNETFEMLTRLCKISGGCSLPRLAEIVQSDEGRVGKALQALKKDGLVETVGPKGPTGELRWRLTKKAKELKAEMPEASVFPCGKCSRILSSQEELDDHAEKEHAEPKPKANYQTPASISKSARDALDAKVKELYSEHSGTEIAEMLKVGQEEVGCSVSRLHYRGELKPKQRPHKNAKGEKKVSPTKTDTQKPKKVPAEAPPEHSLGNANSSIPVVTVISREYTWTQEELRQLLHFEGDFEDARMDGADQLTLLTVEEKKGAV